MTQQEALAWIAKLFDESAKQLTPDTTRPEIKMWDSLGVLLLMGGLDSDFDIQLTDEEVQGMRTVNDILAIMRRKGILT